MKAKFRSSSGNVAQIKILGDRRRRVIDIEWRYAVGPNDRAEFDAWWRSVVGEYVEVLPSLQIENDTERERAIKTFLERTDN